MGCHFLLQELCIFTRGQTLLRHRDGIPPRLPRIDEDRGLRIVDDLVLEVLVHQFELAVRELRRVAVGPLEAAVPGVPRLAVDHHRAHGQIARPLFRIVGHGDDVPNAPRAVPGGDENLGERQGDPPQRLVGRFPIVDGLDKVLLPYLIKAKQLHLYLPKDMWFAFILALQLK